MSNRTRNNRSLGGFLPRAQDRNRALEASAPEIRVTVAIMSYNNASFIGNTIESVLTQEGVALELFVIDDRSSDASLDVIRSFSADPRLCVQVNERNLGAGANFDKCLTLGQGDYIVVLGSDDLIYPGHLQSLATALHACPQAPLAYSQCQWIDEQGRTIRRAVHPGHREASYAGGRDEVVGLLSHDNYITPSAVMFRRTLLPHFRLADGVRFTLDLLAGDWEFWIRIARTFPDFVFVNQASVGYRIHEGQVSQNFYRSEKPLEEHFEILLQNLAHPATRERLTVHAKPILNLLMRRMAGYPVATQERHKEKMDEVRMALDIPHSASMLQLKEPDKAKTPFFSVILSTFNRPELLVHALQSLKAQLFTDFEVVVVNDAGCGVEHVIDQFDLSTTYVRLARNGGLSAARNAALALAQGDFVVYLDDDDIFLPRHLGVLAEQLRVRPDAVVYTGVVYVQERIEGAERVELSRQNMFLHSAFVHQDLLVRNYIPVNTFAHARSLLATVGLFDTELSAFEDWDMLLRLASRYSFVRVPEVTAEVRLRTGPTSDHMLAREKKNFSQLYRRIYARYDDLGIAAVSTARKNFLSALDGQSADAVVMPSEAPASQLQRWLAARVPTQSEGRLIDAYLVSQGGGPALTIFVRHAGGDGEPLLRTLKSLQFGQCLYSNLKIVVFADDQFSAGAVDDKVRFVQVTPRRFVEALNLAAMQSDADWLMLVDAGDEFSRAGLLAMALQLVQTPDCRAVYGDELRRLSGGELGATFRPGFNLDLLLAFPATLVRHWLVRRDVLIRAGGFDPALQDAFELDLLLRLIDQGGLEGLAHLDEVLLTTDPPVLADRVEEQDVVLRHLVGRGYADAEVGTHLPGRYRVRYQHPDKASVSIVIVADAPLLELQRCVESVLEHTAHPALELLIGDPDLGDPAVRNWLDGIAGMGSEQLRVVRGSGGCAAREAAIAAARGDYLLFLDGHAAVLRDDWLDALLNHGQRPEVGVVGAKILDADGSIRHAGTVLGLRGAANSAFVGEPLSASGYMHRLEVDQNYSAVSGICMLVRKSVFLELGGFDTAVFPADHADTDLCLRVGRAGFLVVWTPHALVMHKAGADESSAVPEVERVRRGQDALYERWLPLLARDPAYNKNLMLNGTGFELEPNVGLTWRPLSWRPVPVALVLPADRSGCGHYRMIKPFEAMKADGVIDGMLSGDFFSPAELERYDADAIVFQRQLTEQQLENMQSVRRFGRAFKIYELDDYLPNLPVKSVHKQEIAQDVIKQLRQGLACVDRFVVSTDRLAESFAGLHPDIRVVKNRLPPVWWAGLSGARRQGQRPRVGWAGGAGHTGDLELIADVVRALGSEVEWVFMGLCPDKLRPFVKEVHGGVPIDAYPKALAALNLDVALAPLEHNLFNECKSNLRLLEYGACGVPVVCSDLACYRGELPVTRVKNRFKDWVDAIRMHTADLDAAGRAGDALREAVLRDWMLQGEHLLDWRSAWTGG